MAKYRVKFDDMVIELSKPNSSMLVYKMSYDILKKRPKISNNFIVYILVGKDEALNSCVYVGKSKNGLASRPTSHENKKVLWDTCYILTQFRERSFFNDGTIQYLEDKYSKRFDELNLFINKTDLTNTEAVNEDDKEDCDEYISASYDMLYILGLNLFSPSTQKQVVKQTLSENLEIPKNNERKLYYSCGILPWKPVESQADMMMDVSKQIIGSVGMAQFTSTVFSSSLERFFKTNEDGFKYIGKDGQMKTRGSCMICDGLYIDTNYDWKDKNKILTAVCKTFGFDFKTKEVNV